MAARALSMTAASARLCRSRGLDIPNSATSVPCKDFGAVVRRLGVVPGLRTCAASQRRNLLGFAAGKGNAGSRRPRSGTQSRRKPSKVQRVGPEDEDDVEKALEALFAQLEMDLGSEEGSDGGGNDDDDAEFTDEELAQMTKELEAAFKDLEREAGEEGEEGDSEKEESGLVDMVMKDGVYAQGSRVAKGSEDEDEDEDEEEEGFEDFEGFEVEDDDEPRMVPLEEWQLRKLAAAVEKGRRNVNVKSLSAELGMDRSDVLSFLRDPPPELLLMSAQLEEEDEAAAVAPKKVEAKVEKAPSRKQSVSPPTPSGGPQSPRSWHANKRLKKEHVATFERVYRQTNRPSNTMIENLVNLTHVPRKKILQWFDDKRAENRPGKKSFENAPEN